MGTQMKARGGASIEGPEPDSGNIKTSAWAPLRNPAFRGLWLANVVSNVGSWMQNTAMSWLMTVMAPTAVMVSLVQVAASLPIFLLALPAGAIADVLDRRRIIIFTQTWMLIAAAALGVLTLLGLTTPWTLLLLVLALGIGTALNAPAWQAIVPELVTREQIQPAVALNSAGFNLARAIGPALGGIVLVAFGAGVTFLINAASFLGVIIVLSGWKRPPVESALPAERIFAAMRTGIRFVRYSPALQAVFIRALAFIFFASSLMALLPLFARDHLRAGPSGYGLLLGFFGAGAVAGAAVLPMVRRKISLNALATFTNLIFAASLISFAMFPIFVVDSIAMLLCGAAWLALLSNFNSSVQSIAPAWVRGRCLAVYMLIFFGGMSVSSFIWGAVANHLGIPAAFHISAFGLVAGLAATYRLRLISGERLDLTPSLHWPVPALTLDPHPKDGPVMVEIQYRVDPDDWQEFGIALSKLRRARLRGGAFRWALFVDLEHPEIYKETFFVESWLEHLRQHERQTVTDREIERKAYSFNKDRGRPKVTHLLAKALPEK